VGLMGASAGLEVRDLTVRIDGNTVIESIDLDVARGELVALVGPNGAGKSTLLAAVTGDLPLVSGRVRFDGGPLLDLKPLRAARLRSVLPQESRLAFGFRVREVVEMGRSPWRRTSAEARDDEVIDHSMRRTDIATRAERIFSSLSGGEKARAALARVIAQETPLVLLDEPTAALDIRHQEQVLALASELAHDPVNPRAVVVVLHDLSLAAAWSDRICVLSQGRVAAVGSPGEVITPGLLEQVYGHPVDVISHEGRPVVVPRRSA